MKYKRTFCFNILSAVFVHNVSKIKTKEGNHRKVVRKSFFTHRGGVSFPLTKMPSTCGIVGCKSRGTDKSLSFHRLPTAKKNKKLRRIWLQIIKRPLDFQGNILVCSKHFEESCYNVFPLEVMVLSFTIYAASLFGSS